MVLYFYHKIFIDIIKYLKFVIKNLIIRVDWFPSLNKIKLDFIVREKEFKITFNAI